METAKNVLVWFLTKPVSRFSYFQYNACPEQVSEICLTGSHFRSYKLIQFTNRITEPEVHNTLFKMKRVLLSFVLAGIALVTSAQMSQTPIKTFNDYANLEVFTYENGDQAILNWRDFDVDGQVEFYDLSLSLTKTVDFSTVSGFEQLGIILSYSGGLYTLAFKNDNLLNFIVITTNGNGWAIVNENLQEVFRKSYTDYFLQCESFSIVETKNGKLLVANLYKQTGVVECCEWYEGECLYECERIEAKTEVYALPGYSTSGIPSTTIQQLSSPYPNPAKTYIHLPYNLPEGVREGTIRVFNSQGQLIKTFRVNGFSEYVRLDTSNLPAGNYLYSLDAHGQKGEGKAFLKGGILSFVDKWGDYDYRQDDWYIQLV